MHTTDLLADLSDEQRAAVTAPPTPLAIWAGAGSGKTRVLTRRIAHRVATGSANPRHIVAVTFTRKAAEELRNRLRVLIGEQTDQRVDIVAGTFHAIAFAQLRRWHSDHDKAMPALISSRRSFITRNLSQFLDRLDIDTAVPLIDWGRARNIPADEFHAQLVIRKTGLLPKELPVMAELYKEYDEEKRRRHVLDFEDLLTRTAKLFRADSDFADAQRWRFRHFFVDEVQDINPSQIDLLEAWLGDRRDLCVVGDVNQAIYGWNGADSSYLREFETRYEDARTVDLRDNYRSTPNILSFAHAALEVANNTHTAVRETGQEPTLTPYETDTEEVKRVCDAIETARGDGLLYTDMAILTRTNAQLEPFARELRRRGYPVRIPSQNRDAQHSVRSVIQQWKRVWGDSSPAEALTYWLDSHAETEEALPMAQQLDELVSEFRAIDPAGNTRAFADWIFVATSFDDVHEPGIDLLTFHKAKGLEWHSVFVTGLEAGYVPIGGSDIEEERRLLYVALTRATDRLHCSYASTRMFGSRLKPREPSPFLMRTNAKKLATAETATWKEALAEARHNLRTN